MITLVIDLCIAGLRLLIKPTPDVRHRPTPPPVVVGARPAGAASSSLSEDGVGGHPDRDTSELLRHAALRIVLDPRHTRADETLAAELRDRAAAFAAIGD